MVIRILARIKTALKTPWERNLYILFFAQVMTAVGFSSIFPFLPLYVQSLGSSTGMSIELGSGLVFSSQAVTMMIASPIWGSLADRYGRKLMVVRAMFGGAIILSLMGLVRTSEELILLRAIQGLVTGTVAAANALVAASAPKEHTGYAMGLLQVAMSSGVAVGPVIGGASAELYGYRASFFLTGSLLLLAGLLVLFGVKENFQKTKQALKKRTRIGGSWGEILSSSGVIPAYAMRFISQLGRQTIVPIAPLFITTLVSAEAQRNFFTGLVIGVSAFSMMVSSIYLGRLGDRIGHRKILIASMAAAALLYLPQSMVTAGWQLLALQALTGIALGGVIPSISALLAQFSSPGLAGAVYGLDNAIDAGARSVAPMVGSGLAVWIGMRATFTGTAALFLVGSVLAAWSLPRLQRCTPNPQETPAD